MWFVSCQCSVKYSLSVLECTLTTPNGFVLLQFVCQQISSLSPTRDKSGHVRSLGYGPEPNLDVYAVLATIQLMLGQE